MSPPPPLVINCYNPGDDLGDLKCNPNSCKKSKTYEPTCLYNTQGQFVCDEKQIAGKPNIELGVDFILSKPQNKITLSKPIS